MGILIVEDDYITSKILQVTLEKYDYEVFVVHSGQEALDFLENHFDVQLVMTDIQMPDMDGLELIGMLKERIELKKTPFIVCSSSKEKETVQKAAALGCTDYVLKPFSENRIRKSTPDALIDNYNRNSRIIEIWQLDMTAGKITEKISFIDFNLYNATSLHEFA